MKQYINDTDKFEVLDEQIKATISVTHQDRREEVKKYFEYFEFEVGFVDETTLRIEKNQSY